MVVVSRVMSPSAADRAGVKKVGGYILELIHVSARIE